MPARMTEPAVGASTWASGSQVWTGHIGIFTAKDAKKASHSHHCRSAEKTFGPVSMSVGMSEVPATETIVNMASSIRTEPSRV